MPGSIDRAKVRLKKLKDRIHERGLNEGGTDVIELADIVQQLLEDAVHPEGGSVNKP